MSQPEHTSMNRQQRREQAKQERKQSSSLKTGLLPRLPEVKLSKADLPGLSKDLPNSPPLQAAGPFLNPETQTLQSTPWVPPQATNGSEIHPQDILPSGLEDGGNSGLLPKGLDPLSKKEQKLADDLSGLYYLLGTGASFASDFAAKAIVLQAPILSESHVRMARHIPKYYSFLEKLVEYNDFVPIFATHMAVVAAIMVHHDMVPEPSKPHFKTIGREVTEKVAILNVLEEQARSNPQSTLNGLPSMAL